MFDKAAMFFLMGAMGAMMVVSTIMIVGILGWAIYTASITSPFWTFMGFLLWLGCALFAQRMLNREDMK
jgi:hypothetical protein